MTHLFLIYSGKTLYWESTSHVISLPRLSLLVSKKPDYFDWMISRVLFSSDILLFCDSLYYFMDKHPSSLLFFFCFSLNSLLKNEKACGSTFANSHVLSLIEKWSKLRNVYVVFLTTISKTCVITEWYRSFPHFKLSYCYT